MSSVIAATQPLLKSLDLPGLAAELANEADDVDAENRLPLAALASLRRRGLMGALIPRELGGLGLSLGDVYQVCVAVGEGCGVTQLIYDQHISATAHVARWSPPPVREMLPRFAAGELMLGITLTSSLRGTMKVRRAGDRRWLSGLQPWFTGVGVMTHALVAAEQDDDANTIYMAVVPMTALECGPPLSMVVFSASKTCAAKVAEIDVTAELTPPIRREELNEVESVEQTPIVLGGAVGILRAMLRECRRSSVLTSDLRPLLELVERAAAQLDNDIHESIVALPRDSVDQGALVRQRHLSRLATLLTESGALMMSLAGRTGLSAGSTAHRIAREAVHYFARLPLEIGVATCLRHFIDTGVVETDKEPSAPNAAPSSI